MSDMTISQIREEKEKAQAQIGEILLSLTQRTGLQVYEVKVGTTVAHRLGRQFAETVDVRASIVLEGP